MEAKTARPKNPVRSLFRYLSFLLLSLSDAEYRQIFITREQAVQKVHVRWA